MLSYLSSDWRVQYQENTSNLSPSQAEQSDCLFQNMAIALLRHLFTFKAIRSPAIKFSAPGARRGVAGSWVCNFMPNL